MLANAPHAPTAEQARVIRGLTSSGHGVETVEALAGTGKTFTAGLLAEAYTAGGYRVLGTAPTGRAVRELTEQAGISQAWTLTRLALDLDGDDRGFGAGRAVLILDEAGMASTRETARVMAHAQTAGVKVIAIGDSGQLSSVQAGGWLGSLTERAGLARAARGDAPARSARAPAAGPGAPRRPHQLHHREGPPAASCTSSTATSRAQARVSAPRSPRGASARPNARGGRPC